MKTDDLLAEIALLIYPDCQLSAIYGLTDLMRIANQSAAGTEVPQTARRVIRVSHWQAGGEGMRCIWDSHPDQPHRISHALAPPSIVMPAEMAAMPLASGWLKDMHAQGAVVGSVCAGAFVLAQTGLLAGRRVTTHWAFAETLAARYPHIKLASQNMVLDDGDIITAGGILAWADLGLVLVERLLGPGVMLATARFLLIDPPRRDQHLYQAFIPKLDHTDDQIRRSQHDIHARHAEVIGVPEMAAALGMSERTYLRRFQKATGMRPTEYLQNVRIMKARDALELTNKPVDQIAWDVGYSDVTAFRKIFHRLTSTTPKIYRARFGIGKERAACERET